tara:strand:+ start:20494 stop:21207 length:714 start_codon:yes stop_codon:yes gene_type:complete
MSEPERVLAISREDLFGRERERYFQGFRTAVETDFRPYIEKNSRFLLRRETSSEQPVDAESDESYKQIIPYSFFVNNGKVFVYQRTKGSGEEEGEHRLFGNHSVGIGGHINPDDAVDLKHAIGLAALREFKEEVDYIGALTTSIVGYINDDRDSVGRVHFGVVYCINGDKPHISVKEEDRMVGRGLLDMRELFSLENKLKGQDGEFEGWSGLVIDYFNDAIKAHFPGVLYPGHFIRR